MNQPACIYTQCQVILMNKFRELWVQHVYWTRFFIISTAANLGDLDAVTKRLLKNPGDFAKQLEGFYCKREVQEFKELFTQHLLIGADLVNAAKKGDAAAVTMAQQKWVSNADDIAALLGRMNPYWSEEQWRKLLYDHLQMTQDEAVLRLSGKYQDDIKVFDAIEQEALQMADYMSCGIIKQFTIC